MSKSAIRMNGYDGSVALALDADVRQLRIRSGMSGE